MAYEKQRPLLPQWYTDRFVRTEPKENPADQNIPVIRDAFAALILRSGTLKPNIWFSLEQPVALVTKTSEPLEGTLQYIFRKGTIDDDSYLVSEVQILHKNKWVSRRAWYINILDEASIRYYVDITSESDTKGKWESNRFGSALFSLTNDVIAHLLRHNTHFDSLPVKATIVDRAKGQFPRFKFRRGWTSNHSVALGYTKFDRNEFEKWYRVNDRVRTFLEQQATQIR